jgi:hypothetical protein
MANGRSRTAGCDWSTWSSASPRGAQRQLLRPAHRVSVAVLAQELPELEDGVHLFSPPERTFPEGSFADEASPALTHKAVVAINSDTLEIAAIQYDRKIQKEYIGIFVYKRVNTS